MCSKQGLNARKKTLLQTKQSNLFGQMLRNCQVHVYKQLWSTQDGKQSPSTNDLRN